MLVSKVGSLLEFTEQAEATEYLQSLHHWPEEYKGPSMTKSRMVALNQSRLLHLACRVASKGIVVSESGIPCIWLFWSQHPLAKPDQILQAERLARESEPYRLYLAVVLAHRYK